MIEKINSSEQETRQRVKIITRLPKNIRQIGEPDNDKRVYLEDYVYSFLYRQADKHKEKGALSILLGRYERFEDMKLLVILGAVKANYSYDQNNEPFFDHEAWKMIYEDIKEYFPELEIMGWSIAKENAGIEANHMLEKMHIDNFAGVDKLLFMIDLEEKEDAFYLYQNNTMVRQSGYYVFFDRNEKMQNYILSETNAPELMAEPDEFITNIRSVIQDRKQNIVTQRKVTSILYGASAVLAVAVLVTSIALFNNYDKMKEMQQTLNVMVNDEKDLQNHVVNDAPEEENDSSQGEDSVIDEQGEDEIAETDNQTGEQAASQMYDTYIIQKGDTLTKIALRMYQDEKKVQEIQAINQIEDMHKIYAGQEIRLP